MRFSPAQYKLIQYLLLPKIDELRVAIKEAKKDKNEDKQWELEHELAITQQAAGTIEGFYLNQ
jgi:hypothetical protein